MRIATIESAGRGTAALVLSDGTFAVTSELATGAPDTMLGVIDAGPDLWTRLEETARSRRGARPASGVRLLAPIPRPRRNAFCVGWNYSEHFSEGQGMRGSADPEQVPEWPALFTKNPACVVGPDAAVLHPAPWSDELDWEVELAVIIGTRVRDVSEGAALGCVFGYTVANDVSVRDIQRRHGGQWMKGKNFDTHLPLGPWIITAAEMADPHTLRITSRVNGVTKQDSSTSRMVFRVPRILRDLSLGMSLEPGDVVLTGTPSGVGFARKPPEFLRVGDAMEMEIEKIGVLRNRVERA